MIYDKSFMEIPRWHRCTKLPKDGMLVGIIHDAGRESMFATILNNVWYVYTFDYGWISIKDLIEKSEKDAETYKWFSNLAFIPSNAGYLWIKPNRYYWANEEWYGQMKSTPLPDGKTFVF